MKKIFFFIGVFFWSVLGMGQGGVQGKLNGLVVPLRAANWDYRPGAVEFAAGPSGPVMKIVGRGNVLLKNTDFSDGTIEFDDETTDPRFASFFFRWQDSLENEIFYFRTARGAGHPMRRMGFSMRPRSRVSTVGMSWSTTRATRVLDGINPIM